MSDLPNNNHLSNSGNRRNPPNRGTLRQERREYNPHRHVMPEPPPNADTEEFRQEILATERRLAGRSAQRGPLAAQRQLDHGLESPLDRTHGGDVGMVGRNDSQLGVLPSVSAVIAGTASENVNESAPHEFGTNQSQRSGEASNLRSPRSPPPASIPLPTSPPAQRPLGIPLAREIYSPSPPREHRLLYADDNGDTQPPGSSTTSSGRGFPDSPALRRQREQQSGSESSITGVQTSGQGGTMTPIQQPEPITPPSRPSDPPQTPRPYRARPGRPDLLPMQQTPTPIRGGHRTRDQGSVQTEPPRPVITYPAAAQGLTRPGIAYPPGVSASSTHGTPRRPPARMVPPPHPTPISRNAGAGTFSFGHLYGNPPGNAPRIVVPGSMSGPGSPRRTAGPQLLPPAVLTSSASSSGERPPYSDLFVPPSPNSPPIPEPVIFAHRTPIPVAGTNRTLQETLRRVAEDTPWSGGSTSAPGSVVRQAPLPPRFQEWRAGSSPDDKDGDLVSGQHGIDHMMRIAVDDPIVQAAASQMPNRGNYHENMVKAPGDARNAEGVSANNVKDQGGHAHLDDQARKRYRAIDELQEFHAKQAKKHEEQDATEDIHISYVIRPNSDNFLTNPHMAVPKSQERTPATYNFEAGHLTVEPPEGFDIHDRIITPFFNNAPTTTLEEVLDSAAMVRDSLQRIESAVRDYCNSLKLDEKLFKRGGQPGLAHTPDGSRYGDLKAELKARQLHYTSYVTGLMDDLRKREFQYRRNIECFERQADDPILDPLAGIPQNHEDRTEEQRALYRGRLLVRVKLEKLGYQGGPVSPFLKKLNEDVWKSELKKAILGSGSNTREVDINLEQFDLTNLASLPWAQLGATSTPEADTQLPSDISGVSAIDRSKLESVPAGPSVSTDPTSKNGKENNHYGRLGFIPMSASHLRDNRAVQTPSNEATQVHEPTQTQNPMPVFGDTSDEDDDQFEQSVMTDPGISPGLKQRLSRRG